MGFLRFIRRYNYPFKDKARNRALLIHHMQSRGFSKAEVINGDDAVLPVLIIGAGPVGLVLSILLTKLGRFLSYSIPID
jgi:threonine dehydrogenase-like Zn-dependent dehydrogenase